MGRRVEPLTPEALDGFPPGCRVCLFWELGRPRPDVDGRRREDGGDELAGDPSVQKQAWHTATSLEDGHAGRVVRVDDRIAGYALFAPAGAFAPRRPPVPAVSRDALALATLWVAPECRDGGIGRLLVQASIKEAIARGLAAVEVYADRRFREADCVLPATWLLREGFEVHREHPRYPLLRLGTKRTVRWTEAIGDAVEGILDRVRPDTERSPAPAPHASTTTPEPRGST